MIRYCTEKQVKDAIKYNPARAGITKQVINKVSQQVINYETTKYYIFEGDILHMMGKTHMAVGIATALIVAQPKTRTEFIVATIGGSLGGIMCDIDVKIDKSNSNRREKNASMDALYGEIAAMLLSATLLLVDYVEGGEICKSVVAEPIPAIIGLIGLIILIIIGERSKHRDKTHSILFLFLFTLAVGFINPSIGAVFLFGYASHLFIDLLNKSPIRLFYPIKKGICFKMCYASGLVNEFLFSISICIIGCYLALLIT